MVDELKTSDEYMMDAANDADIFIVRYEEKKSFQEKISQLAVSSSDKVLLRWWGRLTQYKIWSR